MLVDHEIVAAMQAGDLTVEPADGILERIQPASLDVRLGHQYATFRKDLCGVVDTRKDSSMYWRQHRASQQSPITVHPGDFYLCTTLEQISLASNLAARIEGKSSLGRLGIMVHVTAGFIDPGWPQASITLEVCNVGPVPVMLWPGSRIAQLAFERTAHAANVYDGKYVGQSGPTPSQYHRNYRVGGTWL